jgi:hypothetical protein
MVVGPHIRRITAVGMLTLLMAVVVSKDLYHAFIPHDESQHSSAFSYQSSEQNSAEIQDELHCFICSFEFSIAEEPASGQLSASTFQYSSELTAPSSAPIRVEHQSWFSLRAPPLPV